VLKDFLRTVQPEVQFERRFETPPGKQAQVDFAFFKTVFTDQPEVERIVWLFSIVLGHSRMMWARFVARQDLQTVLRCHIAAFEAFGGVPEQILYDRMNVLGDVEDPDQPAKGIAYNAKLLDLAAHYGFLPKACKAYRAKTKGKVERPFRYVREDFFLARTFRDLDDLNAQFVQWLDQVANVRLHATTQRVVVEHFAEERGHLKTLPAGPFNTVLALERRITRDGSVAGNLYSVPDSTRRRRCRLPPVRSTSWKAAHSSPPIRPRRGVASVGSLQATEPSPRPPTAGRPGRRSSLDPNPAAVRSRPARWRSTTPSDAVSPASRVPHDLPRYGTQPRHA
jgi:Integrase core domain